MCIIAIKPQGAPMFDDLSVRTMFYNNPHGAGLMYYDHATKKVVIEKGFMCAKDLLKYLHAHDFTHTNVIMHFRISTSGSKNALNCHPYPVYKQNKLHTETEIGMCHNGILKDYEPKNKLARYNDTQNFIWKFIKKLPHGFLKSDKYLKYIRKEIGDNNKLAFLDNLNRVVMIGKFIHDGDYYYSNHSYLDLKDTYATYFKSYNYKAYDKKWHF